MKKSIKPSYVDRVQLQLDTIQKLTQIKTPKIQQFDLFYEYKGMGQSVAFQEHYRRIHPETAKPFYAYRYNPSKLPGVQQKTPILREQTAVAHVHRPTNFRSRNNSPQLLLSRGTFRSRRHSPMVWPSVKYKVESIAPSFRLFSNRRNTLDLYKRAEYLSTLPINPKVNVGAIEQRIDRLMRIKSVK